MCKIHMELDGRNGELHGTGKSLFSSVRLLVGSATFHPHLMIAEPQVKPAPKPAVAIVWPDFTFPLLTASSNAKGMEAALVLP